MSEAEARSEFSGISSRLAALADAHSILGIFDQFPIFCNDGVCEFRNEIGPLLRDEEVEHLSLLGSEIFAQRLSAWARERMPSILTRPADMDDVRSTGNTAKETSSAAEMN